MLNRQIRKMYSGIPFEIAESQLSHELQAYFQAIHSYPAHFAKSRVSFQRHLLNVICSGGDEPPTDAVEHLEPTS